MLKTNSPFIGADQLLIAAVPMIALLAAAIAAAIG